MNDQILSFIKSKGPTLPVKISGLIGVDILTASAMLSELVSKNELKLTSLKVGNSPLYYIPNQEEQLDQYLDRLHEKEKPVCQFLKQKGVLRDEDLDPLQQVALRNSKDFAKPLNVKVNGSQEVFWKWHTISPDETKDLIREKLGHKESEKKVVKSLQDKQDKQDKLEESEKIPETSERPKKQISEEFYNTISETFNSEDITIIDSEIVRKNSEIDMVIRIPSAVGKLKYYVKARNKKLSNDKDLSSAYVQGQTKNLPVLFIYTGKLTKKAESMLDNEFKHITLKKI